MKTLAEYWMQYQCEVIPTDVPKIERTRAHASFMAGGAAAMTLLIEQLNNELHDPRRLIAALANIASELQNHIKETDSAADTIDARTRRARP